jgi:thioredoxin-dependent peroxiredoxin
MEERTGEAFEFDEQLTVVGSKLRPGDVAPDFALDHFDGAAVRSVQLADSVGRVRLLNIINSLDTPVCHTETRHWEELRGEMPPSVQVYTVSMDLPFTQTRWMRMEEITHQGLSSHRSEQFGMDYGVLLKEWRMLQRAVIVIDRQGHIVHAEYVPDQMAEPDYNTAVAAARLAASQ